MKNILIFEEFTEFLLLEKKVNNMKYLKKFESYNFEDFTHSDMEDVKDLLEEGLTAEEIANELDFDVNKVTQIISALRKSCCKND